MKSNKPYKSLKDVYSESVNGHVAPRRHLRVLGEGRKPYELPEVPGLAAAGRIASGTTTRGEEERAGERPIQTDFFPILFGGQRIDSEKDIDKVVDDLEITGPVKDILKRQLNKIAKIDDPDERQRQQDDLEATIDTHSTRFDITNHLINKGWNEKTAPRYGRELVAKIKDYSTLGDKSIEKLEEFITGGNHPEFKRTTGKIGNLIADLQAADIGVSVDMMMDLMQHKTQDEKIRGVGMGELAMTLFFNNITASKGKGDLGIEALVDPDKSNDIEALLDNGEFEIKGHNAALGPTGDTVPMKPDDFKDLDIEYKEYINKKTGKLDKTVPIGVTQMDDEGNPVEFKANNLAEAISGSYNRLRSKTARTKFKKTLWEIFEENFARNTKSGEWKAAAGDVEKVYKLMDLKNPQDINSSVAMMNFVRYATKEGFEHFMVHDFGQQSMKVDKVTPQAGAPANTGAYVYAGGSPLEMATQLSNTEGVFFQPISFSNARPKVGLARFDEQPFGVSVVPKEYDKAESEEGRFDYSRVARYIDELSA